MDLLEYDTELKKTLTGMGAVHLRGTLTLDADVDFYASRGAVDAIVKTLLIRGFFKVSANASKLQFQRIMEERIIRIDLVLSFDYIFECLKQVGFRQAFLDTYLSQPSKRAIDFNAVRYLFMERPSQKYLNYLTENRSAIIERDCFKRTLKVDPFEKRVTTQVILDRLGRSQKIKILPFLTWPHRIRYIRGRLEKCFSVFGSGQSVAILGPDGCGKSTVVSYLAQTPWARSIYMGSDGYLFGNVYLKITKRSWLPLRIGKFLAVYFENWLKLGKIHLYKFRGKTVYLDRYPAYQYSLEEGSMRWLFRLFYRKLFLKPDIVIILLCSDAMIIERKNELSAQQIRAIYDTFRGEFADRENVYWIENDDLNQTLGSVLEKVSAYAER